MNETKPHWTAKLEASLKPKAGTGWVNDFDDEEITHVNWDDQPTKNYRVAVPLFI